MVYLQPKIKDIKEKIEECIIEIMKEIDNAEEENLDSINFFIDSHSVNKKCFCDLITDNTINILVNHFCNIGMNSVYLKYPGTDEKHCIHVWW